MSEVKKTEFVNRIREMLGEEKRDPARDDENSVELSPDTPHFMNPRALASGELDFGEEEARPGMEGGDAAGAVAAEAAGDSCDQNASPDGLDPVAIEEVLDKGVRFLSGLTAMMTGKPLEMEEGTKAVSVDRETGEVTLRFKLPGFGGKAG